MRDRSPEAKAERVRKFIKSIEEDRIVRIWKSHNKKRDLKNLKEELNEKKHNPIYRRK